MNYPALAPVYDRFLFLGSWDYLVNCFSRSRCDWFELLLFRFLLSLTRLDFIKYLNNIGPC